MATPIPTNRARFSAEEVAAATGGVLHGDPARAIVGLTTDSRAVAAGGAFVALEGATHDGHDHVQDAFERGAALIVALRGRLDPAELPGATALVEVDDTRRAWGALATAHLRRWREARPDGRVVAITGSAGKTTTKDLVRALLDAVAPCHATAGNLNNQIGVPAVVFGLEPAHRFAVLEMGMSEPGEIAVLAAIAPPDVAIVTNVGLAHAGAFGGERSAVAREKGALYAGLRPHGVAVVNADDRLASAEAARAPRPVMRVRFAVNAEAEYRLVRREPHEAGARLAVARRGASFVLDFPLAGEAAAVDLLAGLAAADEAAEAPLSPETVTRALAGLRPSAGRSAVLRLADGTTLVDDSYNANPTSVRAAIGALVELARAGRLPGEPPRRTVAVLGAMMELGPALEASEHDAIGDALADAEVDLVIGAGGLASRIVARTAARGLASLDATDARAAAALALERVRPGDVVLVKGSRSVATERVVEALVASRGAVDSNCPPTSSRP